MDRKKVVVRFAPSPTGSLHVGGARTALFNWLFARNNGGTFLLRIEDTDVSRSRETHVRQILEDLSWLGLSWDEEPVFQSSRTRNHLDACTRLRRSGAAYPCFCSPREIEERRRETSPDGKEWKYDRRCRSLSEGEIERMTKEGLPWVLRFKVPEGTVRFRDMVHKRLSVSTEEIEDFVLLRSDGKPTYHLAVVVDDHEMGITHVIRGDDHISNTPKQLLLYRSLGYAAPVFGHLPLIVGEDRRRLSKRRGAVAVREYRKRGILKEAMVNFLALLGWSSGSNRDVLTVEELVARFSFERVGKKESVFDITKLEWLNREHIARRDTAELVKMVAPRFSTLEGFDEGEAIQPDSKFSRVIDLLKGRARTLDEFLTYGSCFYIDPREYDPEAVSRHWSDAGTAGRLRALSDELEKIDTFDAEQIEHSLRNLAARMEIAASLLIHPTRIALTGVSVSPGLFEVMALLGKDTSIRRILKAVASIESKYPENP
jgi:glutamyl-tRNA synthetase